MRASLRGMHVSGAERLIRQEDISAVLCQLLKRPKEHDFLKVTLERVESWEYAKALPLSSYSFKSVYEAREFALSKLKDSGIPYDIARKAMEILARGPNPEGGNMRGAMLIDIENGDRLEPDPTRGVRTVRMDWESREKMRKLLLERGFTERTLDALAVASKNVYCGVMAELCWSDDPDYLTGYVASKKLGYVRITPLKEQGDPVGGRVYFVHRQKLTEIIQCLERKALLLRG